MTRRYWICLGGGLAALVAIPVGIGLYRARQDEDAYREQLRLARSEGIPVTAAEYAAHIPLVKDADNAAPLYRLIRTNLRGASQLSELAERTAWRPSREVIDAASAALVGHTRSLDLVDRAVERPHCWFDRQWEGYATLFPELADMKRAAQLLGLRGSVAAYRGDAAGAVANARRMLVIAKHAGEEPHAISRLVREVIWIIALRHLGAWASTYPLNRSYKLALSKAIAEFPKPDLRAEHLDEAYSILWLLDHAETKQVQEKLGLTADDLPGGAQVVLPILVSKSKARIKIVEALRACWAAYVLPPSTRSGELEDARRRLAEGMLAFPTAALVYSRLATGMDDGDRSQNWHVRKLTWIAVRRALASKTVARSIDTHDLLSPYDGKPLTYTYDGHRILVEVSGSRAIRLELPRPPTGPNAKTPQGR